VVARSPRCSRIVGKAAAILILIVAGGSGWVAAQPADEPEHAVIAPLAERSLMLDVAAIGDWLVAVGERGHILVSNDRGATWRQAEVPTRATLTGVCLVDAQHGWVVGHDGVILRTADGGTTWERVRWAPEEENPLLDVWFADLEHGFAIGAYGTFLETVDGGTTWEDRAVGEYDYHLHHLAASPGGRLYMAAEAGVVYRSDDGGRSWRELPSP
jgi:photosystem II stability/assembly factor-like uncharacterized protein